MQYFFIFLNQFNDMFKVRFILLNIIKSGKDPQNTMKLIYIGHGSWFIKTLFATATINNPQVSIILVNDQQTSRTQYID